MRHERPPIDLVAGGLVCARFRLDEWLGEGGAGVVWSATHVAKQTRVALKFFKPPRNAHRAADARFRREARSAMAVVHPNVVQVEELIEHDGRPVIVMELLAGESLRARLGKVTRLGLGEAAEIARQLVAAIRAAHAMNVVHRDLKPENVHLVPSERGETVKVLDFGLAKVSGSLTNDAQLTTTGSLMGTPSYMSPEQILGDKQIDLRTDIWSLGIVLFETLSGARPVEDDHVGRLLRAIIQGKLRPLRDVMPELPEDVLSLSERMLSVEPSLRPGLEEIDGVLARYAGGTFAPPRRGRAAWRRAAAVVAILALALFGAVWGWRASSNVSHPGPGATDEPERNRQAAIVAPTQSMNVEEPPVTPLPMLTSAPTAAPSPPRTASAVVVERARARVAPSAAVTAASAPPPRPSVDPWSVQ